MLMRYRPELPTHNEYFRPPPDAQAAPDFSGILHIARTAIETCPELKTPIIGGRDALLFPRVNLGFVTRGDVLIPLQRGQIVSELRPGDTPSYWSVIPQFGRTWRDPEGGGWSRAAFPLMLVGPTENNAQQGLATFRYKGSAVSDLQFQFVQQTAPYLLGTHFVGWGSTELRRAPLSSRDAAMDRARAAAELARRLPHRPWSALLERSPAHVLEGFGGPVCERWRVLSALVRDGTVYYQESRTPYGDYPYPQEMRFGVRSVLKSIGAPLSLLRLAQVYGPYVLSLRIGDFVEGLDRKYDRVRFIDAANMTTGLGEPGSWKTQPNDPFDGFLNSDYEAWHAARSHRDKVRLIRQSLRPYPWEPGVVMRYCNQDFYLLGAAIDRFLKAVRGPGADVWEMLQVEVFEPIGIAQAPLVRTRERRNRRGTPWFNAGYYPTLDDLAKIALLYQNRGAVDGRQILHRDLTEALLRARDAIPKQGDLSQGYLGSPYNQREGRDLYQMGFHFYSYISASGGQQYHLPTMWGAGESEVILYPNGLTSICIAKAHELPASETGRSDAGPETIRAVERLAPFGEQKEVP